MHLIFLSGNDRVALNMGIEFHPLANNEGYDSGKHKAFRAKVNS
jgi:hypothetical protein